MTTQRARRSSVSPVPALSRGTSPAGTSSPPRTPTLPSAFPSSSGKMASQRVEFASNVVSSSYRIPEWDERSVMRAFATHASHCRRCSDPVRAVREGEPLCHTGTQLAKDIGKYFFCWDGKPYSTIDRKRGDRTQVEVPVEYSVIKTLFEALGKGLTFTRLRPQRPQVHHTQSSPSRAATYREDTREESYELRPSRTSSRPQRSNTYTGYAPAPNFVTRSPDDYRRDTNRGSVYQEDRRSRRRSQPSASHR